MHEPIVARQTRNAMLKQEPEARYLVFRFSRFPVTTAMGLDPCIKSRTTRLGYLLLLGNIILVLYWTTC